MDTKNIIIALLLGLVAGWLAREGRRRHEARVLGRP